MFQDESSGEITFYMKGADVVMAGIVQYNDWLEEEVRFFLVPRLDKFVRLIISVAAHLPWHYQIMLTH